MKKDEFDYSDMTPEEVGGALRYIASTVTGRDVKGLLLRAYECLQYVPPEQSRPHCVTVHHEDRKKIQCIKFVRESTGLGLKDAKDLVEAPTSVLFEGTHRECARVASSLKPPAGVSIRIDAKPGPNPSRVQTAAWNF